jgi:hypothetical protein
MEANRTRRSAAIIGFDPHLWSSCASRDEFIVPALAALHVPAFNGSSLCAGFLCTSSRAILLVDQPLPGLRFNHSRVCFVANRF